MKQTSVATSLLLALIGIAHLGAQNSKAVSTYPNELPALKLYDRYLSPLRPYVSDQTAVVQVLGSDQGKTVENWRLWPSFVGDDVPEKGRLAEVKVVPQTPVSMRQVTFPSTFTRGRGGISEINVTCDVYTDAAGLQYWVFAEDSKVAQKGDLAHIIYGKPKNVGQH